MVGFFIIILLAHSTDKLVWILLLITGAMVLFLVQMLVEQIAVLRTYIVKIHADEATISIVYYKKDKGPYQVVLDTKQIRIQQYIKGRNVRVLCITDGATTLEQSCTGKWDSALFLKALTGIKCLQKQPLTFDEQAMVKRLRKN